MRIDLEQSQLRRVDSELIGGKPKAQTRACTNVLLAGSGYKKQIVSSNRAENKE